ncbi:MAG TPA: glucuronate isomerase [Saprospiraceae bacterium]|nr:glucuronate isomerase [Saprospiraceae bacterium]HMQ81434.1 glucuronate isomerase [Saprospiraceae bacterium]
MRSFLDQHFLLYSDTAIDLYEEYARPMPIVDYHNHLSPKDIAQDIGFENLTQAWLYGDHYKWRAMRSNGIEEHYCTGAASDYEKFEQWAATVPYTMRNPLYHWTHLELQRYFDVNTLLNKQSAAEIYTHCSNLLQQPEYSVKQLLKRMRVEWLCTTDDPIDDLSHHQLIAADQTLPYVFPTFRPDKAMACDDPQSYNQYLAHLSAAANIEIFTFQDLLEALKSRHDYFATQGCRLSDHGLDRMYATDFSEKEVAIHFQNLRHGRKIDDAAQRAFKSALIYHFALWNWEKGWTQQFHLGAIRNTNSRMQHLLGADTGWDSIGDYPQASNLSRFLDTLDRENKLTQTIIYNLNPADNAAFATMIGNFNDGSVAGKIQWGSAWWFLDQKDGIEQQLNTLSNMGLLSRFVGMLTDSRSFLSFPRHEYFRRILCNLLGTEIEKGELPNDLPWIGKLIQDVCYYNAKEYFQFDLSAQQMEANQSSVN